MPRSSTTKSKKREVSDEENSPEGQGKASKRVKKEPKDDDDDEDSVETVEPEQPPCIKTLVLKDLWSDDKKVVKSALEKLRDLCYYPDDADEATKKKADDNRTSIFGFSGHLAMVKAMQRFPQSSGIQAKGCVALGNLVRGNTSIENAVVAVDGAEVCLEAMKRFPNKALVQENGCFALGNLSGGEDNAKHIVSNLEGCSVVVSAMKSFPDDADVQQWGCYAIAWMSDTQANVDAMVDAGCRSAVTNAADKYPDNDDIQKHARDATMNLWDFKKE